MLLKDNFISWYESTLSYCGALGFRLFVLILYGTNKKTAIFFASLGMGPVPLILGIFDSRKAPNWEFSRREIRLIGNSV